VDTEKHHPMKKLFLYIALYFAVVNTFAQADILQAGPMVGYSTMREVAIWVQTNKPALLHVEYWEKNTQKREKTDAITTKKETAFTAKLIADKLLPGLRYEYELFINGKKVTRPYSLEFQTQTLWQYRGDAPDFNFIIGSCTYINETAFDRPGEPYGGEYFIFDSIANRKPDFMLWLGDNVYLREPDWTSRTGILHRYTHARSLPEMQRLLGSTHHYAIWDDHDFGPNDSDRSFYNKDLTLEAFKLFWANPNYGIAGNGGITGTFTWNDCQFFLLDNRSFRSPNALKDKPKEIIGRTQADWLIEALIYSKAPFKFVCVGSQFISSSAEKENHANALEEKQYILQRIRDNKIEGVIFLSGDRHFTELSMMKETEKVPPIYDFTISALTSSSFLPKDERNIFQVEGTVVGERNFCTMKITGKNKERTLSAAVYNNKGELKWTKEINEIDLKYKK
jgi:alkaline phosphatase D